MSTLTLTPASALPGTKVTVIGKGYPKAAQVLITFGQQVVASVTSDSSGNIRTSFVVPAHAAGKVIVRSAIASSGAAALQVLAPASGDRFTYR